MSYLFEDTKQITSFAPQQKGVISISDMCILLHSEGQLLYNRIENLLENKVIQKSVRGLYLTKEFDPYTLAQKINPTSYISLETILAEELMIGTIPKFKISSVKTGRPRSYSFDDYTFKYYSITPTLYKGIVVKQGIKKALPEKALLDTLYYYNRGEHFIFDLFGDLDIKNLDKNKFLELLNDYKNPNFKSFANDYFIKRY